MADAPQHMDWILDIAKQVPALAVLAWIVRYFLGTLAELTKQDAERAEKQNERHESQISGITKRHEAQLADIAAKHNAVVERNSNLYERVLERLSSISNRESA